MRFQDPIFTSSTPQQAAPVQQSYPGAYSQIDQTATGSIVQARGTAPRPQGDVQSGGQMVAAAPVYNAYPAPSQPTYSQPAVQGAAPVTRSTLGAPAASAPVYSAPPQVQSAQPLPPPSHPAPVQPATVADAPTQPAPLPAQTDRLAVLPQQPKVKEQQPGTQTASSNASGSPASSGGAYTVVAGDTLSGISRKTGASVEALKQANGLSSGLIRIGQRLVVPAAGAAPVVQTVAAPRTDQTATAAVSRPEVAAYTPPKQAEAVIQQAALDPSASAPDATGISQMRWPVRGRVISGFGNSSGNKKNDGIDIAVPAGTPIKAAENGVVIYAGDGLKEFGNTVLVRHEDGLVTVYGHASELKVQRGQKVRRGEDLALAGMSGSADTPKLHFEVRKDSTPVNPVTYLE